MTQILLYDNSTDIRQLAKKVVYSVSMKTTIDECETPEQLFDNVHENIYDAVIIDIDTLGGKLLEIIEGAKFNNPKVTFIILTYFPNQKVYDKLKLFGIEHYFDKNDQLNFFLDFLSFIPAKTPDENNNLVYKKVYQMSN